MTSVKYTPSVVPGSLRTLHQLEIGGEKIATTRAAEVLEFAKPRIFSKVAWKALKNAVRLGEKYETTQ